MMEDQSAHQSYLNCMAAAASARKWETAQSAAISPAAAPSNFSSKYTLQCAAATQHSSNTAIAFIALILHPRELSTEISLGHFFHFFSSRAKAEGPAYRALQSRARVLHYEKYFTVVHDAESDQLGLYTSVTVLVG